MKSVRVLDLFSGGGGSSYGARSAGCQIVAGVDAWATAAETYRSNFHPAQAFNFRLEGDRVREEVRQLGQIDLLLASPECTSHTCARGARPRSDESRMTAWQVLHHARELRPRWVIVENVVQMRSWSRYHEFLGELSRLGYGCTPLVLDSADFGVPQTRRRLFIVCGRDDGFEFQMREPQATRVPVSEILDPPGVWRVTPLRKKGRAPSTIQRAERAIKEVGQNERFLMVYYGSDAAGGWQSLDRPLRTLTTLDRFALVEPSRDGHTMRMLQVPELKRAMGFGATFRMENGTRRDQVKLLGNGVCPPVMRAIVKSVIAGAIDLRTTRHVPRVRAQAGVGGAPRQSGTTRLSPLRGDTSASQFA